MQTTLLRNSSKRKNFRLNLFPASPVSPVFSPASIPSPVSPAVCLASILSPVSLGSPGSTPASPAAITASPAIIPDSPVSLGNPAITPVSLVSPASLL